MSATVVGTPVWSATKYVGIPNDLIVAVGDDTPSGIVEPGTAAAPVFQFALAPAGANVTVTSVTLAASGTLDDASEVLSVSLYRDVNANGRFEPGTDAPLGVPSSFAVDDGTVTFSGLSRTVPAGGSDHWLVVYDLSPDAIIGRTFRVEIAAAGDVGISGGPPVPTVSGPPIQGRELTVEIAPDEGSTSNTHHGGCGGHPGFASPAGPAGPALLFLAFVLFVSALKRRNPKAS
ncbi:MAG: hypothetical protein ACYS47_10895 [Planctomycetota bacterium]